MKTSKYFIIAIIFIFIFSVCQAVNDTAKSEKPEKVYSIIYVQKPNEWYVQQEKLWKVEINKNPQNTEAWHNYYNSVRYMNFVETIETKTKKERLDEIMEEMGKAIPNTFEYHYLKCKTYGCLNSFDDLQKAYNIDPNRVETYSDFISYYEIHGIKDKKTEFCKKLYAAKDVAPQLMNYNFNTLMSTEQNAILFTNGDNDTYPVWLLQDVKSIRNDVTILNASLIMADKSYLNKKLKEKGIILSYGDLPTYPSKDFIPELGKYISTNYPNIPVYYALTMWRNYITPIEDNLYLVGLAYKYSNDRIDNIALIKKNLEKNLILNYLKYDWYSESEITAESMKRLNLNYTAPIISLAEHYQLGGEVEQAEKWKNIAVKLAGEANKKELIEEINKKFK
jgi:hypothetical protein